MLIECRGRSIVMIDGANLFQTAKALSFDIDFKKFRAFMQGEADVLRFCYYTAMLDDEQNPIRPLVDFLSYNGFKVVTKRAKEFTDSSGARRIRGNMDIEIVVDALDAAAYVDQVILFSGDGDFVPMVEALQRRGVVVTVVSSVQPKPAMVADDLRRAADQFIDLIQIKERVERERRGELNEG